MNGDEYPPVIDPAARYCARCGEIFVASEQRCPRCGSPWSARSFMDVSSLATMLTELQWLREDGLIDEVSYQSARSLYERRLAGVRPAISARPPGSAHRPVSTGGLLRRVLDPVRARAGVEAETPPPPGPPRPPRETLGAWASARQADILLYLGAFLLAIATLIFVGYQGEALTGWIRYAILLVYTLAFLALGVMLPRWDRVREAGPVFLALGALLLPINFIALRVQVFGADVLPDDVLILLGATLTGAFYILLAARGFGRLYAIPGAIAVVVAWTALFAVLNLPEQWLGVWWAAGGAALLSGTALFSLPAVRWVRAGGIVLAALGLIVAHAVALDGDRGAQLPVAYALVTAAAALLAVRQPSMVTLGVLPPLAVAFGASLSWTVRAYDPVWFSVWVAGAGLGYLVLAERDRQQRDWWRGAAGASAAAALILAYGLIDGDRSRWHLPCVYALIVGGAAWELYRGRVAGTLLLPAVAAMLGVSVLQAAGVAPVWWSYSLLAAAIAIVLAEPWWSRREVMQDAGWIYALILALAVPLGFVLLYDERPAHGVAGFGIASIVFFFAAFRVRGALVRLMTDPANERMLLIERQMLARAAGVLLYAAAGYVNARLGLEGSDRAWIYAAIGGAMWLALTAAGRRRAEAFGILMPGGVLAVVVATALARDDPGRAALILVLGTAGAWLAVTSTRRPLLWVIGAASAIAALIFAWNWRDLDLWLLPLVLGAVALALSAALAPARNYVNDERGWSIALLSWAPWAVALIAARVVLGQRQSELPVGEALPRTREWAVLSITAAACAAAVVLEGARLRTKWVIVLGSAGLLVAGLLGIAIVQPENVQAYTLPAGLYLIGLGFVWRRSASVIGTHLYAHEAAMVAGMAVLLLPAAEQSFQPNGGRFGLELIAAGLILITVGLGLTARWLVVGGVLTLTGVAVRWLTSESTVPYWLTLGLAGMALLGFGMLLLLERDRWDRFRERVGRWWRTSADPLPAP